jgi:hypothetical protein
VKSSYLNLLLLLLLLCAELGFELSVSSLLPGTLPLEPYHQVYLCLSSNQVTGVHHHTKLVYWSFTSFFPGLASNHDPPNLPFQSIWDYGCASPYQPHSEDFKWQIPTVHIGVDAPTCMWQESETSVVNYYTCLVKHNHESPFLHLHSGCQKNNTAMSFYAIIN